MIHLPLRYLASEPAVPLFHSRRCRVAKRFGKLVTRVWRALPDYVTRRILEACRCGERGLAIVLAPSLPKVSNPRCPGVWWRDGGMLLFSADRFHGQSDRRIEEGIARQLARAYRQCLSGAVRNGFIRQGQCRITSNEELDTQRLLKEWGFSAPQTNDRNRGEDCETARFNQPIRRLVERIRRARLRREKNWTRRVRLALEACLPDNVGPRYHDERTGYKCSIGGSPTAGAPRKTSSATQGGSTPQASQKPSGAVRVRKKNSNNARKKQQQSSQQFKKAFVERLTRNPPRTPAGQCALIARLVKKGAARRVVDWAVAECVGSVMFSSKLQSLGDHGFDLRGRLNGRCVLLDVKHSRTIPGYHDKFSGRKGGKEYKILEAKNNPDCVPAYLVFVEGRGIYFHVGIDPAQTARFETAKGNPGGRGLSTPRGVAHVINRGKGELVPFVQLSDSFESLHALRHMKPEDLARIKARAAATIRGIDMDKLRKHLAKQRKAIDDELRDMVIEDDVDGVARAVAKKDPAKTARAAARQDATEAAKAIAREDVAETARAAARQDAATTARAGLKAMTPEQRAAFLKELEDELGKI